MLYYINVQHNVQGLPYVESMVEHFGCSAFSEHYLECSTCVSCTGYVKGQPYVESVVEHFECSTMSIVERCCYILLEQCIFCNGNMGYYCYV